MKNFWNDRYIALSATCSIPSSYIVEPSVQKKKRTLTKAIMVRANFTAKIMRVKLVNNIIIIDFNITEEN